MLLESFTENVFMLIFLGVLPRFPSSSLTYKFYTKVLKWFVWRIKYIDLVHASFFQEPFVEEILFFYCILLTPQLNIGQLEPQRIISQFSVLYICLHAWFLWQYCIVLLIWLEIILWDTVLWLLSFCSEMNWLFKSFKLWYER